MKQIIFILLLLFFFLSHDSCSQISSAEKDSNTQNEEIEKEVEGYSWRFIKFLTFSSQLLKVSRQKENFDLILIAQESLQSAQSNLSYLKDRIDSNLYDQGMDMILVLNKISSEGINQDFAAVTALAIAQNQIHDLSMQMLKVRFFKDNEESK